MFTGAYTTQLPHCECTRCNFLTTQW